MIVFASGDFGFNLYWQSAMLYLLFYYTEVAHLSVTTASLIYLVASVWDGLISFVIGLVVDQWRTTNALRRALIWGAVPLGISFVMAYYVWPVRGYAGGALFLVAHILFRTAYAWSNIPYLVLSARLCSESHDRTLLSGLRILAGTMAAMLVARETVPFGLWITNQNIVASYASAATAYAIVATALIVLVGFTFKHDPAPAIVSATPPVTTASLRAAFSNRAFVVLCAAMMTMTIATTMINKSILYYFKYAFSDQVAGQNTLGWMMAVGAVGAIGWTMIGRMIGVRQMWCIASLMSAALLAVIGFSGLRSLWAIQCILLTLQFMITGMNLGLWAMLPDTIDYGELTTGVRVEAILYGLNALFQRIAIGLATVILGFSLRHIGFSTNVHLPSATLIAMKQVISLIPMLFFFASGVIILFSPLRKIRQNPHGA